MGKRGLVNLLSFSLLHVDWLSWLCLLVLFIFLAVTKALDNGVQICHSLFTLFLDVIGRLCSVIVALPGHLNSKHTHYCREADNILRQRA